MRPDLYLGETFLGTKEKFMSDKVSLSAPIEQEVKQAQPGEVGYTPPTEAVPLPSRGLVYPIESPIHGAEVIEIRSMTARDEDILTSRALLKQGKAIGTLLKSCITNRGVDPEKMIIGDRNAVLIAIRITGYGREYAVTVDCPVCGEKVKHEFDLADLPIKSLDVAPVERGQNAFRFALPVSKKEVIFKILTGEDEHEVAVTLDRAKKLGGTEAAVTTRLLASIISVGGETDRAKLAQIVRNLPARDSRDLRNYIDKISPGVEMVQKFSCSSCGEESEVDVPMGTEFFWPS
jgi:predicted RNA-binding Zn-ribbon protein involved in translation (DUF1610 family)